MIPKNWKKRCVLKKKFGRKNKSLTKLIKTNIRWFFLKKSKKVNFE